MSASKLEGETNNDSFQVLINVMPKKTYFFFDRARPNTFVGKLNASKHCQHFPCASFDGSENFPAGFH